MSDPLVIAVDSSTSATKAVVVDKSGQVLSTGKADIDLLTPGMDMYEHDPVQWWESTETAISQACAALSDADRQRIKALCITHQRESFALVDEDGGALRPAILWLTPARVTRSRNTAPTTSTSCPASPPTRPPRSTRLRG